MGIKGAYRSTAAFQRSLGGNDNEASRSEGSIAGLLLLPHADLCEVRLQCRSRIAQGPADKSPPPQNAGVLSIEILA
jgi:hypothetical protein